MTDINRTTSIVLPADISNEILQKTQEASAIMQMARHINLPGRGLTIPVITGDPTAAWVSETNAKPVSNSSLDTKLMKAYKIAVIETFSKEFVRDAAALYQALVQRLPYALSAVFDGTVTGAIAAPGDSFDTFVGCTTQSISTDAYAGLVAADTDIAVHGGIMNGIALAPQARGILLAATDDNKRPLFVNNTAEGAIPMILGAPTHVNKGIYKAGTPAIVGVAGDWTQALYGTVEGVEISVSDTATLTSGETTINLWQQNMVAVRAEIEVGFRADKTVFNLLTGSAS